MGSIGNTVDTTGDVIDIKDKFGKQSKYEGERTSALDDINKSNISKKLGLKDLTSPQKDALLEIFNTMIEKDTSYDAKETPYKITKFEITQNRANDDIAPSKDVAVVILSESDTGIRKIDNNIKNRKTRIFSIDEQGNYFTYEGHVGNPKRVKVNKSDALNGYTGLNKRR